MVLISFSYSQTTPSKELVAYYKFDDDANDHSGLGNHGIINGDPEFVTGVKGNALRFDGDGDFVEVANHESLNFGKKDFSYSLWFKVDDFDDTYDRFLLSQREYDNGYDISLSWTGSIKINFVNYDTWDYVSPYPKTKIIPELDKWYHLAVIRKNGLVDVYVDGIKEATKEADFSVDSDKPLNIGNDVGSSYYFFKGLIDEVKIYNSALTSSQVKKEYNDNKPALVCGNNFCQEGETLSNCPQDCKLVAHYDFNDNTEDKSGNEHHGTIGGDALFTQGIDGKGLKFCYGDDYVDFGSKESIDLVSDMTISAWIYYYGSNYGHLMIIAKGNEHNDEQFVFYLQNEDQFSFWSSDFTSSDWRNAQSDQELLEDEWYYLTAVYKTDEINGNKIMLYIDGELDKSIEVEGTIQSDTNNHLYVGKRNSGSYPYYFDGLVDEVKIYNRALTSEEIKQNYDSTSSSDYVKSGLVAYYPFDNDVKDYSGNDNNGKIYNCPKLVDGKVGKALELDDDDSFVEVENDKSLSPEKISFSAWIYPTKWGENDYGRILSKGYVYDNYDLYLTNSKKYSNDFRSFAFSYDYGDYEHFSHRTVAPLDTLSLNHWYHVVATYDNGITRLYSDGKLVSENNKIIEIPKHVYYDENLFIGNNEPENRGFDGIIDELKIYNYILSPEQVVQEYNKNKIDTVCGDNVCEKRENSQNCVQDCKLLAHYKLDGDVKDYSGNNNHGTNKKAGFTTEATTGQALNFNGNNYVEVHPFNYDLDEITASFWMKSYDKKKEGTPLSCSQSFSSNEPRKDNEFLFYNYNNFQMAINQQDQDTTGISTTDGKWHHVAATWGGSDGGLKLIVDGSIASLDNLAPKAKLQIDNIVFGQEQDSFRNDFSRSEAFIGTLDEVKVYNYDQAITEIRQDYKSTILKMPDFVRGLVTRVDGSTYYKNGKLIYSGSMCPYPKVLAGIKYSYGSYMDGVWGVCKELVMKDKKPALKPEKEYKCSGWCHGTWNNKEVLCPEGYVVTGSKWSSPPVGGMSIICHKIIGVDKAGYLDLDEYSKWESTWYDSGDCFHRGAKRCTGTRQTFSCPLGKVGAGVYQGGDGGILCAEVKKFKDFDADGYLSLEQGGEDCDDGDPNVYPGAEEVYDKKDNDCDGEIDEGHDLDKDSDTCTSMLGLSNAIIPKDGNIRTVLTLDVSGSMGWQAGNNNEYSTRRSCTDHKLFTEDTQRFAIEQCLSKDFINAIMRIQGNQIGVVHYSSSAHNKDMTDDKDSLIEHIDSLSVGGGTCICCGINNAVGLLSYIPMDKQKSIVLLSDGAPTTRCHNAIKDLNNDGRINEYDDAIQSGIDAGKKGIVVFTIGFGEGTDKETMSRIAKASGGRFFDVNVHTIERAFRAVREEVAKLNAGYTYGKFTKTDTAELIIDSQDNNGIRFIAPETGHYLFSYDQGSYSDGANNWLNNVLFFINNEITWGYKDDIELFGKSPINNHQELGQDQQYSSSDQAQVYGQKTNFKVFLRKDDFVIILANDYQDHYHNNQGEVEIEISRIEKCEEPCTSQELVQNDNKWTDIDCEKSVILCDTFDQEIPYCCGDDNNFFDPNKCPSTPEDVHACCDNEFDYVDADGNCVEVCPDMACVDNDEDGYYYFKTCKDPDHLDELDCDDENPDRYFGAFELCDDIDRDCDGDMDTANGRIIQRVENTLNGKKYYYCEDGQMTLEKECTDVETECDGVDENCDSDVDELVKKNYYLDNDNDGYGDENQAKESCRPLGGYVTQAGDCNDNNPEINPLAEDVCDGIDNNCQDGTNDEILNTFYFDKDEDGFGDNEITEQVCTPPDGYVYLGYDCDDDNADIRPGVSEVCEDEIDNDCDTKTDKEDSECSFDKDEDGYDSVEHEGDDCDDDNPYINPGVEDVCDGIDNNCADGITDEKPNTYYQDADADGYGNLAQTKVSCIQPSGYVIDSSDCDDNNIGVYPGAEDICDTLDHDCDGDMDTFAGEVFQEIYSDDQGQQLVKYCFDGGWLSKVCGSEIDCNNKIDDDCDGNIDEADECTTKELKLKLHEGWNIMSVTVDPDVKEIDKALELILDNLIIMREYQSDGAKIFDPTIPARFNSLKTIGGGKAYQIKMKDAAELTINGLELDNKKVNLHKGWNMMPYLGDDVVDIEPTIALIKDNVVIIREYASNGVFVYDPTIPARFNSLKEFKPETGYQVKMKDVGEVDMG